MPSTWATIRKLAIIALLLLVLALPLHAFAQQTTDSYYGKQVPPSAISRHALPIQVLSGTSFSSTEESIDFTVKVKVTNPSSTSLSLYHTLQYQGIYYILDKITTLSPGETRTLDIIFSETYNGKTSEQIPEALVGISGSAYYANTFTIEGEWSHYEPVLNFILLAAGVAAFIMLACIFLVYGSGIAYSTAKAQHTVIAREEYSIKRLFLPKIRSRPLAESLANIVTNPVFWVIEIGLASILVLLIYLSSTSNIESTGGLLLFAAGGLIAFTGPLALTVIAWLLDVYEREPFRFISAMFVWGIFSASMAFILNTSAEIWLLFLPISFTPFLANFISGCIMAPLNEEPPKAMGVLLVSGHHELDGMFDGMLYGFVAGMGFAAMENWLYFSGNVPPIGIIGVSGWFELIVVRSLLSAMLHGCAVAITGGGIGLAKEFAIRKYGRFGDTSKVILYSVAGMIVAIPFAFAAHALFNYIAINVDDLVLSLALEVLEILALLAILATIGIFLQYRIRKSKLEKKKGDFSLSIDGRQIPLYFGSVLYRHDLTGEALKGPKVVIGTVVRNPKNPKVLGFRNMTDAPWSVTVPDGSTAMAEPGKSVALGEGCVIEMEGHKVTISK